MTSPSFLSNSLFSTIVTLYTLILLYFPSSLFLYFISSPILISTLILLLSLLRLVAIQNSAAGRNESNSVPHQIKDPIDHDPNPKPEISSRGEPDPDQNPTKFYVESFVEWDVRAPLEIIYEEYEGEEAEKNDAVSEEKRYLQKNIIQKYASLSSYYPEYDSESSSEGDFPATGLDSPENMCFRWGEEDDREGLIEIALDDQKKRSSEVEEDNLIEIDLFPAR